MVKVIGIRFQTGGKLDYFDPGETQPNISDKVLVETSRGFELGEVIMPVREVSESSVVSPLKTVIHMASPEDLKHERENKEKEKEAFRICQEKIVANKLEMKLVRAEIGFENNKILFYFTANGRVDFRALVKDLAAVFKTRIELRQIGVRDEARMIGGLGPCGRPICCDAFLDDFEPVSIKMAKEQKLSLNPTKISGVCGRLMCCLKYEEEQYEETRKRMPKVGKEFQTPEGTATVLEQNILKETVLCRVYHGDTSKNKEYSLEELVELGVAKPVVYETEPVAEVKEAVEEEQATAEKNEQDEGTEITLPLAVQEMNVVPDVKEKEAEGEREHGSQNLEHDTEGNQQHKTEPNSRQRVAANTKEKEKAASPNENKEAHAAEDHKAPATQRADAWRAALEKAMEAANSKMQ